MTIEFESSLLSRRNKKEVLKPGACVEMESHIIPYRLTTHIHVVSEDEVRVVKQSFRGEPAESFLLRKGKINEAPETSTFYGMGVRIIWTPTTKPA